MYYCLDLFSIIDMITISIIVINIMCIMFISMSIVIIVIIMASGGTRRRGGSQLEGSPGERPVAVLLGGHKCKHIES